ncbi:MAG: SurA N-terminal domain-containing protein [Chitinophagales bacterium]|nr:SurA N-terminal domain-containing protein [Chitinophagales bacterium]MDW8427100.1 SurA N-terminal domain-containing protein [Chitinophagales bacterium]
MALIQTIRNKFGPIVVILIGVSLAVFVLETALQSETALLRGSTDVVGIIDGEKIRYAELANRIEENISNYKLQTNQSNIDENTLNSLREQTWNQLINERINHEEYRKLGLSVPVEELKQMFFSNDPVPEIKQAFTNPQTGVFDPVVVRNYYENLDQTGPNERPGERRQRWVNFEKAQKEQRLSSKYSALIKGAIYVPKWLAEEDYKDKNRRAQIRFVMLPYHLIPDTEVNVTDGELLAYLNANKARFQQEESRHLEYVLFTVNPSPEDTAVARRYIEEVYQKLLPNPVDTDLIKLYADKGLDPYYYSQDEIESETVSDTLFKVKLGTLIGPYFEEGAYKLAVLLDRRSVPDSVKARHILVRVEPGADTSAAWKKIDSIARLANNGEPFDSLAKKFSEDEGTRNNGGNLGSIAQGKTVKNFNHYLFFEGKVGELRIVRTEFGYHLIRIDEIINSRPKVQVALISRAVEPSSETDKRIYDQAQRFAAENATAELFDRAVTEKRLQKLTAPVVMKNTYSLPGLPQGRQLVQWAFAAEVGEVSAPFAIENHYVVALLRGAKQKGTPALADVRPQVEMAVRKEKKGALLAARLQEALALNATLEGVAAKVGQPVKKADHVVFSNAYAENLGYEPRVIGAVFALNPEKISQPILGEQGVFVVQVDSITEPPAIADYSQFKQQIQSSLQPRMQYQVTEALKKMAQIEDNRVRFF